MLELNIGKEEVEGVAVSGPEELEEDRKLKIVTVEAMVEDSHTVIVVGEVPTVVV